MYCKHSNVHLCFPGLILPLPPPPRVSSQQPTLSSPGNLPAVTHILFSNCMQNDVKSVRRCWTSFHNKTHVCHGKVRFKANSEVYSFPDWNRTTSVPKSVPRGRFLRLTRPTAREPSMYTTASNLYMSKNITILAVKK